MSAKHRRETSTPTRNTLNLYDAWNAAKTSLTPQSQGDCGVFSFGSHRSLLIKEDGGIYTYIDPHHPDHSSAVIKQELDVRSL